VSSLDRFLVSGTPFYLPQADEIEIFEAAHRLKLPVMLKGPTGVGKTRFLTHMAARLKLPLITIACHEDLSATDLTGRHLIAADETVWVDGPLTLAVRHGAICYLDEIVEARKDTTVVIHPLTDDRRQLTLEKRGETLRAHSDFMLVVSYNPGYQSLLKELKPSTRQRFVGLNFDWPPSDLERRIVMGETGADEKLAEMLVRLAGRVRALTEQGLDEGASTRLLVQAARLIQSGVGPRPALERGLIAPLTDDPDLTAAMHDIVDDFLPSDD
jgi:nitric oxide reductase NorQ protein